MKIRFARKTTIACGFTTLIICAGLFAGFFWLRSIRSSHLLAIYINKNNTFGAIMMLNDGANPNTFMDPVLNEQISSYNASQSKLSKDTGILSVFQDMRDAVSWNRRRPFGQHETVLMDASKSNNTVVVHALLQHGADPNATTTDGATALFFAASARDAAILNMLIEKGAKVNLSNNMGLTPLFVAVGANRLDNVKILLSHGADIRLSLKSGLTPIQYARKLKYSRIASLLSARQSQDQAVEPGLEH